MWDFKNSDWLQVIEPGTLVLPQKTIYLTPVGDVEEADWPEWTFNQVGIVLPSALNQIGVLVLTCNGIGVCFSDEIKKC